MSLTFTKLLYKNMIIPNAIKIHSEVNIFKLNRKKRLTPGRRFSKGLNESKKI